MLYISNLPYCCEFERELNCHLFIYVCSHNPLSVDEGRSRDNAKEGSLIADKFNCLNRQWMENMSFDKTELFSFF